MTCHTFCSPLLVQLHEQLIFSDSEVHVILYTYLVYLLQYVYCWYNNGLSYVIYSPLVSSLHYPCTHIETALTWLYMLQCVQYWYNNGLSCVIYSPLVSSLHYPCTHIETALTWLYMLQCVQYWYSNGLMILTFGIFIASFLCTLKLLLPVAIENVFISFYFYFYLIRLVEMYWLPQV